MRIGTSLVSIAVWGALGCMANPGDETSEHVSVTSNALRSVGATFLGSLPATPSVSASTIPSDGDVNPYGIAFVPPGFPSGGLLRPGDVVVANFNNSANLQGTGTTIVRVHSGAAPTLFFQDTAEPGFSTALGVLRRGFVIVGTVPSTDGSGTCTSGSDGQPNNVGSGSLLVIDSRGKLVERLTDDALLDGPWDLTVDDDGDTAQIYVSNVLRGSVTRLDVSVGKTVDVLRKTQIASGYGHRCDSAAFVVGPTGLALDPVTNTLFVASTADNAIYAVAKANRTLTDEGKGRVVVDDTVHLHGPLGLARTRGGHLISAQGDAVNADAAHPSEIVEFTEHGAFVDEFSIDPAPGSAFGLALEQGPFGARFAAVDDGLNVLDVSTVR